MDRGNRVAGKGLGDKTQHLPEFIEKLLHKPPRNWTQYGHETEKRCFEPNTIYWVGFYGREITQHNSYTRQPDNFVKDSYPISQLLSSSGPRFGQPTDWMCVFRGETEKFRLESNRVDPKIRCSPIQKSRYHSAS